LAKLGTARQTTDDNIVQSINIACWVPKATDTHSEFVIIFAFPLLQWLRESPSISRLYLHCRCYCSNFFFNRDPASSQST